LACSRPPRSSATTVQDEVRHQLLAAKPKTDQQNPPFERREWTLKQAPNPDTTTPQPGQGSSIFMRVCERARSRSMKEQLIIFVDLSVVELFRAVKREKQQHREILAFSISHDNITVRIYSHYPLVEEDKATYYRHPIHKFDSLRWMVRRNRPPTDSPRTSTTGSCRCI
jgi:hypothetical protein